MQLVLVMFRAEGERRSFSLTKDVTTIGRREDCDLRIPVSEVSRKHCRIIKDGDAVRVEDLGSSNGTFHNGQRIQGSVNVDPGDSVQVGPVVFVVQVDGVPDDEELQPFTDRAAHELDDSMAGEAELDAEQLAEADANTAGENLDEMMLGPSHAEGEGELEPLSLEDEPHAIPAAEPEHDAELEPLALEEPTHEPEPAAEHREEEPLPMDDSHEAIALADSTAGADHHTGNGAGNGSAHKPDHDPIPLDLDDEHAGEHGSIPLSEDELLLDLKDDKHERHA